MTSDELIRFDYAIKKLLRNKGGFGILEGFIEVFLGKKCKIQSILESESNKANEDDKYNRVDIKAEDEDGEIFIVEVQTSRYTYYLERILFGVSKAVTEQVTEGDHGYYWSSTGTRGETYNASYLRFTNEHSVNPNDVYCNRWSGISVRLVTPKL